MPYSYTAFAVTRTMARKAQQTNGKQDFDLTDTFLGQSFNNEITKSLSSSHPDM